MKRAPTQDELLGFLHGEATCEEPNCHTCTLIREIAGPVYAGFTGDVERTRKIVFSCLSLGMSVASWQFADSVDASKGVARVDFEGMLQFFFRVMTAVVDNYCEPANPSVIKH